MGNIVPTRAHILASSWQWH